MAIFAALLVCGQLLVHQYPLVLLEKLLSCCPQCVLVHWVVLQGQDFALPFTDPSEIPVGLDLQPAEVPLHGSTPIQSVNYSFQSSITDKPAKHALCSIMHVTNEEH